MLPIKMVSLAWDGHHRVLVNIFEKLLGSCSLVDCTIVAEGQKLKVHKCILSAFSPYFELLFKEESENNSTVILSGISFRDLSCLVDFMYQGKLNVPKDRLEDLIDAAECLRIKGLGAFNTEESSENSNKISISCKRSTLPSYIPHKRTRKVEDAAMCTLQTQNPSEYNAETEPDAENATPLSESENLLTENDKCSVNVSKEAVMNHMNHCNLPFQNSVAFQTACLNYQHSHVQKNIEYLNVQSKYNPSAPSRSKQCALSPALSSTQMDSLLFRNVSVIKIKADSDTVKNPPSVSTEELKMEVNDKSTSADSSESTTRNKQLYPMVRVERMHWKKQRSLKHIRLHRREQHGECDKKFVKQSQLLSHKQAHKDMYKYTCDKCGMQFRQKLLMEEHWIQVHDEQEYTQGELQAAPKCDLKVHQLSHGPKSNNKSMKQDYAMVHSSQLKEHQKTLSGLKPFKCTECNFATATKSYLKRHQQSHSVFKSYMCVECDFSSSWEWSLLRHERIHSKLKPFKCTKCKYSSIRKDKLKIHQRIHSELKVQ